ncbi:hypothetical protein Heshes_20220 [Alicyclobacillus hesperidum]|uniref:Osmoprotectant transport system permease protein n=1 Tax=Alicyclobacillus hesperidum TaxID=89784 RepID=A0A1H2UNY5_9BACL|nr:ABC transporter permease [Alicyclobacillus hesperidum]GLV14338.1 hypothetical protein Heshes_20220 [Alicyclobacillus hesperidum]SDW57821.1 osmoprotectant transport system permease protein [Alicyclobacillus hesperidum]
MPLWQAFNSNWGALGTALGQHIYLSVLSILIASVIAIPLGVYITGHPRLANVALTVVSIIQTIPSLALLGFMVPLFGIGTVPAVIALVLYALLPIVRNTYTGIMEVDQSLIEAARGMGMTKWQTLFRVQLPLARNVMMAGLRTATVLTIGVATLATFIGAGGLGDLIMRGVNMIDPPLILVGAIPAALLAIVFDQLLHWIDRRMTPRGLR